MARTQTGTPFYFSPELWTDQPYNHKSDMFALGCIIYEMCMHAPPFYYEDMSKVRDGILNDEPEPIPPFYSSEFRTLIAKMMSKAPDERPSCDQILELPFIRKEVTKLPWGRAQTTPAQSRANAAENDPTAQTKELVAEKDRRKAKKLRKEKKERKERKEKTRDTKSQHSSRPKDMLGRPIDPVPKDMLGRPIDPVPSTDVQPGGIAPAVLGTRDSGEPSLEDVLVAAIDSATASPQEVPGGGRASTAPMGAPGSGLKGLPMPPSVGIRERESHEEGGEGNDASEANKNVDLGKGGAIVSQKDSLTGGGGGVEAAQQQQELADSKSAAAMEDKEPTELNSQDAAESITDPLHLSQGDAMSMLKKARKLSAQKREKEESKEESSVMTGDEPAEEGEQHSGAGETTEGKAAKRESRKIARDKEKRKSKREGSARGRDRSRDHGSQREGSTTRGGESNAIDCGALSKRDSRIPNEEPTGTMRSAASNSSSKQDDRGTVRSRASIASRGSNRSGPSIDTASAVGQSQGEPALKSPWKQGVGRARRASVSGVTNEQRRNHGLGGILLSPNKAGTSPFSPGKDAADREARLKALSPTRQLGKAPVSNGFQMAPEMRGEMSEMISGFVAPPARQDKPGLPSLGRGKTGFKPKCSLDIPEAEGRGSKPRASDRQDSYRQKGDTDRPAPSQPGLSRNQQSLRTNNVISAARNELASARLA